MKKQTFVRNVHSSQCKVLNVRLTEERLKMLRIAAAMEGLSTPLFVEKQLDAYFNENDGRIKRQNITVDIQDHSKQWELDRANTQMTLGEVISALSVMPEHTEIKGLWNPHSYRGYYSDLAFEETETKSTAGIMLKMFKGCLGATFMGWKGGDFTMSKITPIWIAQQGTTGVKIVGLDPSGQFTTREDEY